jgi:hypothetical protein
MATITIAFIAGLLLPPTLIAALPPYPKLLRVLRLLRLEVSEAARRKLSLSFPLAGPALKRQAGTRLYSPKPTVVTPSEMS